MKYDDFMYRMGLADKPSYWNNKIKQEAQYTGPVRHTIAEQEANVMAVQQGVLGSVQEMLGSMLGVAMSALIDEIPAQYKSGGVQVQQPSSLIAAAFMEGTQLDVVPTRVEVRMEIQPSTLKQIICTVAIDDGIYDPRDYRVDEEVFTIDWTSPMGDLIGMVVRYLNSRRRGIGPRG